MWYDLYIYFSSHLGEIVSLLSILGTIVGMILWSYMRLHADIESLRKEMQTKNDQANQRIDASLARIDGVYQFLMKQYENPKTNS